MRADQTDSRAVSFFLEFPRDCYDKDQVNQALVTIGPDLKAFCAGLFQHWRASRHVCLGKHNELRFQFRTAATITSGLAAKAETLLRRGSSRYGFQVGNTLIQNEPEAFGEGDSRGVKYDVIAQIKGRHNLQRLWSQMEQATEWAIEGLRNRCQRDVPGEWFSYAKHLYRNLLGLE